MFLKDIGGEELLMGLALAITCAAELPFFFYSGTIIQKFGAKSVLYVSLFAYAIRLLYYSYLTEPWAVLPAELLHGITFAAFYAAA